VIIIQKTPGVPWSLTGAAVAVKCVAIPPPPVLGNDTGMGGAVAVLLAGAATDPVVSAVLAELPTSASVRETTVAVAGITVDVAGMAAVATLPEGALVSVGRPV